MKYGLAFLSLLGWWLTSCKSSEHTVHLTLSYTRPYCNGARPTPDMEEAAQQRHPMANQMFYFVKESKVDSVKSDAAGSLTARLKGEGWIVLEAWQFYKKAPDNGNMANYREDCLKDYWRKTMVPLVFTPSRMNLDTIIQINYQCPFAHPCVKEGMAVPE